MNCFISNKTKNLIIKVVYSVNTFVIKLVSQRKLYVCAYIVKKQIDFEKRKLGCHTLYDFKTNSPISGSINDII